jgi:hypothetical protein
MGSLFKPDVQDTTQKTELPPWMNQYGEWLTGGAQGMADRPYVGYEGDRFAGFNPMQQDAFGSMDQFGQMGLSALGGGYNALSDLTGAGMMGNAYAGLMGMGDAQNMRTPQSEAMMAEYFGADPSLANRNDIRDVAGGSFLDESSGSIQDYMNPYTQGVSDNVLSDLDRSRQVQDQQQRAQANAAGAFGGSRHGVLDAITTSEYDRNAGQLSNQLWNQAYGAASNLKGQDLNRDLQAGLSNQGMDWNVQNLGANLGMFNAGNENALSQFNAGLGTMNNQFNASNQLQNQQFGKNTGLLALQAAGGLGNMMGGFTQQQGRNLTDFGTSGLGQQLAGGNQQQGFGQAQYDQAYQDFLGERDWQANNFGQFGGMGMGAQGNMTSTGQAFGPSKFSQLAGGAAAAGGLAAGLCSRDFKDLTGEVDAEEVLEKLERMELHEWNYKGEEEQHFGPVAEDFNEAIGKESKYIQMIDGFGFLMAATKALAKRVQQLEAA